MYCPNIFREHRTDVLFDLIETYPLATLITTGSLGLLANLMPFSLCRSGGLLRAHLARGNTQLAALREGAEALLIFQGPEAYVSPSWYASKAETGKVVPTWNFVMVQVRGLPKVIDDPLWIAEHLGRLTDDLEADRGTPWRVNDAPEDFVATQLRAIVGIEIPIRSIEGKWKISQNRSEADHGGVVEALRAQGTCPEMVKMMATRCPGRS
ncbi:FMN-binding negative transcriptional regulator [Allohahella sp. A8]|uniref:FMN-binding negative transcriptional regulator n=1 Tax=Allohahella sp. A8 TaxID=3141461 RepID=UPI003A80C306